jgi:hypothetical protein
MSCERVMVGRRAGRARGPASWRAAAGAAGLVLTSRLVSFWSGCLPVSVSRWLPGKFRTCWDDRRGHELLAGLFDVVRAFPQAHVADLAVSAGVIAIGP